MRPYFEADGVAIYHGDARIVLATLCLSGVRWDAVCADPPYGTGWYEHDADISRFIAQLFHQESGCCFGYPERLVQLCRLAERTPSEWIVWWPTNGACRGFNLAGARNESEHIAFFGRHRVAELREARSEASKRIVSKDYKRAADSTTGHQSIDVNGDPETRRVGDVWRYPSPGLGFAHAQRQHPNEKPEPLMLRLVEAISEPGQTILDPTCGSGTALWAARQLGRKAIGIDIDERCCEMAAARLAQGVLIA